MTDEKDNREAEEFGDEDGETGGSTLVDADFSALEGGSAEIAKLAAEAEENKNRYLRALADLENYKRRALKERSDLIKYQGEKLVFDILEIVDNLELALQHSDANPEKLKEGVELIYKRFKEILNKWEIRDESGLGREFDPSRFSAISKVPSADVAPGTVINELKKAYFYKDKLLRVGEVVVSGAVGQEQASDQAERPEDSDENGTSQESL